MKFFITGGSGFLGYHLVERLLKQGNEVSIYDDLKVDNKEGQREILIERFENDENFRFIKGDIIQFEKLMKSMKNHEIVFHLAANADIAKSVKWPDLDFKTGIIGTYNVLKAMKINNIKKIVFTSGSGIYGDLGKKEASESYGPLKPTSMYGSSKLSAEGLISAFCHLYDMQAWIFRFANIVGKHQTHGVAYDFIRRLKDDSYKLLIMGDGKQSKSYIHISDVLNAIFFVMMNSKQKVNIFNVASDDYLEVNEIAKIVCDEMKLNPRLEYTGGSKGWKGDVPVVRFNLNKIHKSGWKAKLSSKEAVKKSVKEMIENASK